VPVEVAADLEVAERNARRLGGLVRTLLDLAAADANRLVPHYEFVDLAAEIRELASLFRSAVEAAGLALRVECELDRPVRVDRTMWAKIVVNLLANALKFTFEGEIRVALRERAKHAELVVSDTGVGIPAADRPHV
jgi:signal transduction histidine kinase